MATAAAPRVTADEAVPGMSGLLSIHPDGCCGAIDIVRSCVAGWHLRCERCGIRSASTVNIANYEHVVRPCPDRRPGRWQPTRGWQLASDCLCVDRSGLVAAGGPQDRRDAACGGALTMDIECSCSACGGPRTVWVVNQPCAPERAVRPERLARWFMALSPWSQRS